MELETIKELAARLANRDREFVDAATTAWRYYRRENDILNLGAKDSDTYWRKSDYRIASNFYNVLVNQKASFKAGKPTSFDVGNDKSNKIIQEVLGEKWPDFCNQVIIEASNCSIAWIYYWRSLDGEFCYTSIDPREIRPIWGDSSSNKELIGLEREYHKVDPITGKESDMIEYWDNRYCYVYEKESSGGYDTLTESQPWHYYKKGAPDNETPNRIEHGFDTIPFIPLFNNNVGTTDLSMVKDYIDAYDIVYSGFLNDVMDIQEVLFVLTAVGGQDPEIFKENLRKYKVINLDHSYSENNNAELDTLSIEIPIEARQTLLDETIKCIFVFGQGYDTNTEAFGNVSGVALEHQYTALRLKCNQLETGFRPGYAKLVRAICKFYGLENPKIVNQKWHETYVADYSDKVEQAVNLQGILSHESILEYLPMVDNASSEKKRFDEEESRNLDDYVHSHEYTIKPGSDRETTQES